jgi:hypothetical protein
MAGLGTDYAPSDDTQERIIAHGRHQSLRETRRRAPAQDQPEVMDDTVKPGGAPRPRRQLRMWPISTRVNKPENDDASIMEAVGAKVA